MYSSSISRILKIDSLWYRNIFKKSCLGFLNVSVFFNIKNYSPGFKKLTIYDSGIYKKQSQITRISMYVQHSGFNINATL